MGRIHFVDLAGAEKLPTVTTNTPKSLRQNITETHNINVSLNALGDVLSALAKNAVAVKKRVG